jgi:hypothetical protein
MSRGWEDIFPLVQIRKLVSDMSDHNPLLIMRGDSNDNVPKNR